MATTIDQMTSVILGANTVTQPGGRSLASALANSLRAELASQQASLAFNRLPASARALLVEGSFHRVADLGRQASSMLSRNTGSSALSGREVGSSNPAAVTGTAVDLAAARSFGIDVTQLAATHAVSAKTYTGGATNEIGSQSNYSFDLTTAAGTFAVAVDLSGFASKTNAETLAEVRDQINAATGSGVFAEVRTASTGKSYLALESHGSGAATAFTVADTTGTLVSTLELDRTGGGDPTAGVGGVLTTGQDAVYSIDSGAAATSASNTLSLFSGSVSLTLAATTGGAPATVTVRHDAGAAVAAIEDLLTDYNDALDHALANSSDLTRPLAAALSGLGDALASQLHDVGIARGSTGLFTVDSAALTAALQGPGAAGVEALFLGASGLAVGAQEISRQFLLEPSTYAASPESPIDAGAARALHELDIRGLLADLIA